MWTVFCGSFFTSVMRKNSWLDILRKVLILTNSTVLQGPSRRTLAPGPHFCQRQAPSSQHHCCLVPISPWSSKYNEVTKSCIFVLFTILSILPSYPLPEPPCPAHFALITEPASRLVPLHLVHSTYNCMSLRHLHLNKSFSLWSNHTTLKFCFFN